MLTRKPVNDDVVTQGRLNAGSVELNYRLQGRGARQLICIHGVGSYLEAWEGVAAHLCDDFRILTFDLRGHGRSSHILGRYEIDEFVDDTLALADPEALAAGDDDVEVGWPDGGVVLFLVRAETSAKAPPPTRNTSTITIAIRRPDPPRRGGGCGP